MMNWKKSGVEEKLGNIHLCKQLVNSSNPIFKVQEMQEILQIILVMHKDITQIDDLCYLQNLTEENILDCLTKRYEKDKIFTTIGQTLLAINPYKQISFLFEKQKLNSFKESVLGGVPNRQPHIYAVASRTFQGILNRQKKQSIVISGESGAGKTQSAKYCLKMLTHFSQQYGKVEEHLIQKKLLACNPILQAFGNSKTVRNDNSSRFGKYLQIYFDANQTVRGANIRSYLLEKTRVVYVAPEQRNFHIFYALCSALNQNPGKYHFLNQSNCLSITGKSESQTYQQIRECMDELSFPNSYQEKIEKLLISILMLGNLQFDDSEHQKDVNSPCTVKNHQLLEQIASILECDCGTLISCFVKSRIQMPKEVIMKSLDKTDCILNRNTLCKVIYNGIFESVINKMNEVMTPDRNFEVSYRLSSSMYSKETNINSTFEINILDIFGFENFNENSLQQLCINYTNQKLLNIYNKSVFQNEVQQLREDEIDVQLLTPPTAEPKIALLQEVFKIIKEKTLIRQFKDEDIISAFKTNRENNSHIRTIQYDKLNNKKFLIKHSPVDITYSVMNFKSKNQDKVSEDIQNIYANVIPQLQQCPQARTLLQKFTLDIRTLTEQLQSAQNHYVRCIKPNDRKRNEVNHDFMMRQIRYLGVFETIKIRKSVFPFRKTYDEFCLIYRDVFKRKEVVNSREKALFIMKQIQASTQLYMFGNRRIYLSTELQEKLNSKLVEFQKLKKTMANKIIKAFRKMQFRQKIRIHIKKIIFIIKILKRWGERIQGERKQLLFNSFTFIRQESEEKINEKKMIELFNSLNQQLDISEISHFESKASGNVYQTVCRLKSLNNQSKIIFIESEANSQKEKIKTMNKEIENYKVEEAEMKFKIATLEKQIYQLQIEKDKVKILESKIEELSQLVERYSQQLIQSKKKYTDLLEIQRKIQLSLQMQKARYKALAERLEKLQKQNIEVSRNLNQQNLLTQHSQSQHQNLQIKMIQIEGLKKQLLSKEILILELKEKENIDNAEKEQLKLKNKEMEQRISIKAKKEEENIQRVKTLQQIILDLQKAQEDYTKQNKQLFRAKEAINEKCYQKIKELEEAKKKIKEYEDKDRFKDLNKEALERMKLKANFLQNQNQKMKKKLKQMDNEITQYITINQKLREKINDVQQKQTSIPVLTNPITNEIHLSQKQILQHVVSLKGTLNINQLRVFKNKIIMCLP